MSGSWTLVLPSRNMEVVGDSGLLSCRPTFCCHPSLRLWQAGTLFQHTRNTVPHSWLYLSPSLVFKVLGLSPLYCLW